MTTFGWRLAIACVVLIGCATAKPAAAPSVDVTGAWAGTFTWAYGVSPITMTLRQAGADVTGDIVMIGTLGEQAQANGPVRGTVSGESLALTFAGGGADMNVRANQMTGFSTSGSRWVLQRQ